MKKVILVGIMFMMFMGVVSAASINGDYKGNPIVTIYSDSTEVKPDDVPALIYNGRTVVPISMLKKIGLTVTWNQSDYSVDVNLPISNVPVTTPTPVNNDKAIMKMYGEITDQYRKLMVLGDVVSDLSNSFFISFSRVNSNNNPNEAVTNANSSLNNAINAYNDFLTPTAGIISRARALGVDISDNNTILSSLLDSINVYRKAYVALEQYRDSKSDASYNDYSNNNQQGFELSKKPRTDSLSKYYEFYNKLQDY